eukprot:s1365_g13.t1
MSLLVSFVSGLDKGLASEMTSVSPAAENVKSIQTDGHAIETGSDVSICAGKIPSSLWLGTPEVDGWRRQRPLGGLGGNDPTAASVCVGPAVAKWSVASGIGPASSSRDMVYFLLVLFLLLSPILYLVLNSLVPRLLGSQDLKLRYGATWALVTGGSSGIGKELARKLLSQGLNVVIVARDEPVFAETLKELKAQFPKQEVRSVKANLSDSSGAWMADVKDATKDVNIQLLFNNAGFIVTGFFEQHSVDTHLANFHCNLTANIHLTHHFYSLMINKGLKGCIVFTSSSAGFIPNPFAAMYGCTKSGVSELAASLAVEGKARGVDVHAVHPSPVNSRFTSGGGNDVKVHKMNMFEMAYKMATGPEVLPNQIFAAIGRSPVMIDLGGTSIGMRHLWFAPMISFWLELRTAISLVLSGAGIMSKGYLEETLVGKEGCLTFPLLTLWVATESGSAPSVPKDSAPAPAAKELSPEELAKLSKEERKAYHEARRAAQPKPAAKKQLTKAERREEQEAQRKAKEEKTKKVGNDEELLAELKLQGLSEDQAREMAKEMQQGEKLEGDDDDDGEGEDLGASIARWMSEQDEKITKESLRDFNMKVRWQGHVNTLPADHLGCILKILFKDACTSCDLSGKLQPTAVAEKLKAPLARWAPVLEPMYQSIDDVIAGPDCVCSAAPEAVNEAVQASNGTEAAGAAAIVGCYMALREADILPDDELLMGCRRISSEHPSTVLEKFIEFLEDAQEDDSEEEEDELAVHFLGYNLMTYGFALAAPLMPDYKNNVNKEKSS